MSMLAIVVEGCWEGRCGDVRLRQGSWFTGGEEQTERSGGVTEEKKRGRRRGRRRGKRHLDKRAAKADA
jgi:hypothetical protein